MGNALAAVLVVLFGFAISRLSFGENKQGQRIGMPPAVGALISIASVVIAAALVLVTLFVQVNPGQVGVVVRLGAITGQIFQPGLSFKLPIDDVTVFDTRVQKDQVDSAASSQDLQEVKTIIALNFHLDPAKAANVLQEVGPSYKERVIDPAIQEAVKAITASFTAEQLITQREKARDAARQSLALKLSRFNIIVDELNIVDFKFSTEFEKAIEAKQVAAQRVKEAENKLRQIEVEAQQQVIQAEAAAKATVTRATAEANANRLLSESITDKILSIRSIEKWDGKLPQVTGGAVPFINVPAGTPPR